LSAAIIGSEGKSGCDKVIRKLSLSATATADGLLLNTGLQDAVDKGTLIYVTKGWKGNAENGKGNG
jgi:hypothetical protein